MSEDFSCLGVILLIAVIVGFPNWQNITPKNYVPFEYNNKSFFLNQKNGEVFYCDFLENAPNNVRTIKHKNGGLTIIVDDYNCKNIGKIEKTENLFNKFLKNKQKKEKSGTTKSGIKYTIKSLEDEKKSITGDNYSNPLESDGWR